MSCKTKCPMMKPVNHTMPRAMRAVIVLSVLATVFVSSAALADDPDVVVFHREGCGECEYMDQVLSDLHDQYPQLKIRYIKDSDADAVLMWSLSSYYGIFPTDFPVIFVGDEAISGGGRSEELRLREAVSGCMRNGCTSPLVQIQGPSIPWKTYAIIALAAVMLLLVSL